ncbi:MAG: hypothetical protein ABI621_11755 [Chloroflexota bacterium]
MTTNTMNIKQQVMNWMLVTLRESAWAPVGVFGFYLFGLLFNLYDLYPPLDIPTHFMGGVAITYLYRTAIHNSQKILGEIPPAIQIMLAFAATGTTTVFWEFYENILDYFLGTQMVRGLGDTLLDMFLGLFGALVLSLLYRRR